MVDVNVPDTPLTVNVVTCVVEYADDEVCLTQTVSPLLIKLSVDLKLALPQPMEYSPALTPI